MIEKIDESKGCCFDFLQHEINKEIIKKINEIIDYINEKENLNDE